MVTSNSVPGAFLGPGRGVRLVIVHTLLITHSPIRSIHTQFVNLTFSVQKKQRRPDGKAAQMENGVINRKEEFGRSFYIFQWLYIYYLKKIHIRIKELKYPYVRQHK